jgi:hypothetical protein
LGYKTIKLGLFVFAYLVSHFEVYSTRQKNIIYVREKVTSQSFDLDDTTLMKRLRIGLPALEHEGVKKTERVNKR